MYDKFLRSLEALFLFISRIWGFLCYILKRQIRKVYSYQSIKYVIVPLSPISQSRILSIPRKTLVLDLDETLIHSRHDGVLRNNMQSGRRVPPDFVLKVTIDRHPVRFFVHKRPHVDYFLSVVAQWYHLVVYTASMEIYGTAVADRLDQSGTILKRRYFRQHCEMRKGSYTKNLHMINSDMKTIFILDNSPAAYMLYPNNAIPIESWFHSPTDTALLRLLPILDSLRFCEDVRSILSRTKPKLV